MHKIANQIREYETLTVRASTNLSEEAFEACLLEPCGGCRKTLSSDGRGHTSRVRAGTVRVEVLVHLDRDVIPRVLKGGKGGGVARRGSPG
jgi:hypothetical protein